jgi:hypothetical protein
MTYQLKNLNVSSLDFDDIKNSLINFLEQQSDLKNLDFRNPASSVNMLLNILATVTAYNGVYAQFGFANSFASTATVMESLLGIASNSSVVVAPVQSARVNRTVTTSGVTLEAYSTFRALSSSGANVFFYTTEQILPNTSKSINLYSGTDVVSFTNYDYDIQGCNIPYTVDPDSISMYETIISTGQVIKWTKVDKFATTETTNNTHFTIINSPSGYLVTNNFNTSKEVQTTSVITIQAVLSNGGIGNNARLYDRPDAIFSTTTLPSGGYDLISVEEAKAKLLFKATGQERCVTLNDYQNAILSSGIPGTNDLSKIFVKNDIYPGQIKIYITDLSSANATSLINLLQEKTPLGINLVYKQ